MDHLGAEPHDQQHRLRAGVAEDLVADVDAVGAGDLRRLMGESVTCVFPRMVIDDGNSMARFFAPQKAPLRQKRQIAAMLTGPPQRCGMAENRAGRDKPS